MLIRFFLIGIANTFIGLSIIYFAMYFLKLGVTEANALGYLIGILFGFALNKVWTFNNSGHILSAGIRYLLVLAIAYIANLATVIYAHTYFDLDSYLVQAIGTIPYTIIGYVGCRYFAFPARQVTDLNLKHNYKTFFKDQATNSRKVTISVVVPCYNEEAVLLETARRLSDLILQLISEEKLTADSRIYFVDDGSDDRSWDLIESLAETNELIHGIKLSRNRGHQNALLAGLFNAEGEAVISIDADLQDDLLAIKQMIDLYSRGIDIVYGVRESRDSDTFFKRKSAQVFYRLLKILGLEIIYNHADYRLMSRRAIEALREYNEVNVFLRGIIPQLGFPYAFVYYDRAKRFAGESKYPFAKMISFAWQGITSLSDFPLRFITGIGLLVSVSSFTVSIWALSVRLFTEKALPGWASTVLPIYFLGGIQLLCLGIMGEYLAKIYLETKRRPRYVIEKKI